MSAWTTEAKRAAYDEVAAEIARLLDDEGGPAVDDVALMATINSALANRFDYFFWTGFYRAVGETLVIGPYIGTLGCLQIPFGKGVCGTAASRDETVVVPDVHAFPGHIACDARTRSEIVVPVHRADGSLLAVLDVDSDRPAAFDDADRAGLESLVLLFRH